MKINHVNFYQNSNSCQRIKSSNQSKHLTVQNSPNFHGNYNMTKILGGTFGTIAAVSAAGFVAFSSGLLASVPFILGYGAIGAGSGAIIGRLMDKASDFCDNMVRDMDLSRTMDLHV